MSTECFECPLPNEIKGPLFYAGPHLKEGAKPTLFFFCTAAKQTLTTPPFSDILKHLSSEVRIFSMSLPFHYENENNRHALRDAWSPAFHEGSSFLEDFFEDFSKIFKFLQDNAYLKEDHIAAGGISRGGLIASHVTARHPEITHLLGFAPVTDLSGCPYFLDLPKSAHIYDTSNLLEKLNTTHIFYLIGNHDIAVSTTTCLDVADKLSKAQFANKIRSPRVYLKIRPSIGHRGHGTPPEAFKEGAEWLHKQFNL